MAETVGEFLEWLKEKGVVIKKADKQVPGRTRCRAWREVGNIVSLPRVVSIEYVNVDDPIDFVMTEQYKNIILKTLKLKDS